MILTRRTALIGLSGGLLAGCDRLVKSPTGQSVLELAEKGNFAIQRSLTDRMALAREYDVADRSKFFRGNGTQKPVGADYAEHLQSGFANWSLEVAGLVNQPKRFTLADIKSAPQRTQTTRHDCVEGWSAIGTWMGPPLKLLLDAVQARSTAKYVVFECADLQSNGQVYYESIDMVDALHPQTILAWALNDAPLPVANGAPLRLRVERQLGYKHAKYVQRIRLVDRLDGVQGGKGGYWEDNGGYEWYAGI